MIPGITISECHRDLLRKLQLTSWTAPQQSLPPATSNFSDPTSPVKTFCAFLRPVGMSSIMPEAVIVQSWVNQIIPVKVALLLNSWITLYDCDWPLDSTKTCNSSMNFSHQIPYHRSPCHGEEDYSVVAEKSSAAHRAIQSTSSGPVLLASSLSAPPATGTRPLSV